MVAVSTWYGQSLREAARCSMQVANVGLSQKVARWSRRAAGVGQGRREAARRLMRVADVGWS